MDMDEGKRLAIARRLYVEEGKKLAELCVDLDINIFTLNKSKEVEQWDKARAEFLEKQAARDPSDTLAGHVEQVRQAFRHLDLLRGKLSNQMITGAERKQLSQDFEDAKNYVEALKMTIELDRMVHGVKNSAPSAEDTKKKVEGVAFKVILPKMKKQTGTA